jgi:uncharacterized protein YidB (DUF937 family)
MPLAMNGVIEGFYGTPWTWAERLAVCRGVADAGGDTYVYAPKDDPLHRDRWRDPYPDDDLAAFESLRDQGRVRIGFAVSPGLSIDCASSTDRDALLAKVSQLLDVGIDMVVLALDDLPPRDGLGAEHGALTAWMRDRLAPEVDLAMVPNHYTGCVDVPYLTELRSAVPTEVPIGWTGRYVVNDRIELADVEAWTDVMGRAPLLWDNYPVNDVIMADRLFLGPLPGRDRAVPPALSGYLANGMLQAAATVAPVRSAVAWARGGDPAVEWSAAIGDALTLAQCCDQHVLDALTDQLAGGDAGALERIEDLLDRARTCTEGGLGDAVAPWVERVQAEANVGASAVRILRAIQTGGDDQLAAASLEALAVAYFWPAIRVAGPSVFGPRRGFRPVLGQFADGAWMCRPEAFDTDANAIDRLVQMAVNALGSTGDPAPGRTVKP